MANGPHEKLHSASQINRAKVRIANLRSFERRKCIVHGSAAGVVAWFPGVVSCNWSGSGLGFGAASELCCICAHSFLANMAGFRTSPTLTRQIFPKHFRSAAWQLAHKSACSSTSIQIPLLLGAETPIHFRGSLGVVTIVLEGRFQVCFPAKAWS